MQPLWRKSQHFIVDYPVMMNSKGTATVSRTKKAILQKYAEDNGFRNLRFFVDDGYSGTNFDRPDFQRMIAEMGDGNVATIIVKRYVQTR